MNSDSSGEFREHFRYRVVRVSDNTEIQSLRSAPRGIKTDTVPEISTGSGGPCFSHCSWLTRACAAIAGLVIFFSGDAFIEICHNKELFTGFKLPILRSNEDRCALENVC